MVTGHVDEVEGDRGIVGDALARVVVPDDAGDLHGKLACVPKISIDGYYNSLCRSGQLLSLSKKIKIVTIITWEDSVARL